MIAAAQAGDARAMRRIVDLLSGPVYRYGRSFCGHVQDAEDVSQSVMLALVRSLASFRGEASLSSWAYAVARNACARRRRRGVHAPTLETLDDGDGAARRVADVGQDPARDAERSELRAAIERAMRALPTAHREVLMLRDVEGLRAREVGKILGISERAVKSRLHRARAALRTALTPHVDRPAAPHPRCPDTAQLLSRYLEGELDSEACTRLAGHVAGCPSCGQACETLRHALRACQAWGGARVPPAVVSRLRRAVREALTAS